MCVGVYKSVCCAVISSCCYLCRLRDNPYRRRSLWRTISVGRGAPIGGRREGREGREERGNVFAYADCCWLIAGNASWPKPWPGPLTVAPCTDAPQIPIADIQVRVYV